MTTALATVAPEVHSKLLAEGTKLDQVVAFVEAYVVDSPAKAEEATNFIRAAKAQWQALEDERKSVTAPALAIQRTVNAWFKTPQGKLEGIETSLRAKVTGYALAQRRAQEAAMVEHAKAIAANVPSTALIAPTPEPERVTIKERWAFRITDPEAVPREFCTVDEAKIRKAIWYANTPRTPPRPIPGVEFYLEGGITVREMSAPEMPGLKEMVAAILMSLEFKDGFCPLCRTFRWKHRKGCIHVRFKKAMQVRK